MGQPKRPIITGLLAALGMRGRVTPAPINIPPAPQRERKHRESKVGALHAAHHTIPGACLCGAVGIRPSSVVAHHKVTCAACRAELGRLARKRKKHVPERSTERCFYRSLNSGKRCHNRALVGKVTCLTHTPKEERPHGQR